VRCRGRRGAPFLVALGVRFLLARGLGSVLSRRPRGGRRRCWWRLRRAARRRVAGSLGPAPAGFFRLSRRVTQHGRRAAHPLAYARDPWLLCGWRSRWVAGSSCVDAAGVAWSRKLSPGDADQPAGWSAERAHRRAGASSERERSRHRAGA